jgi:hypothetical protein
MGLRTQVLPGISSLDTLIVDLGFDPGTDGLAVFEATDVLLRERPLQPDVPLLLLQMAALETSLFSAGRGNPGRFHRMQEYLLRFYPPSHLVTMTLSSSYPLIGPLLESFPVEHLADGLADGFQSGTLFVPPTHRREVRNERLFHDAYDQAHLRKITARPT